MFPLALSFSLSIDWNDTMVICHTQKKIVEPKATEKSDTEKLAGKWRIRSWLEDGESKNIDTSLTIGKGKITKTWYLGTAGSFIGGTPSTEYELTLKTEQGKNIIEYKDELFHLRGIYRIKDNVLEICHKKDAVADSKEIPKAFDAAKGSGNVLETYTRVVRK